MSGGVRLIEGLRLGRGSVFTPLKQARNPRPGIGGRRACTLDKAGWRGLHPCGTPVGIGVASIAVDPVADDCFLYLGGVAGAGFGERFRANVSDHDIDRPLVAQEIEEGWVRLPACRQIRLTDMQHRLNNRPACFQRVRHREGQYLHDFAVRHGEQGGKDFVEPVGVTIAPRLSSKTPGR